MMITFVLTAQNSSEDWQCVFQAGRPEECADIFQQESVGAPRLRGGQEDT